MFHQIAAVELMAEVKAAGTADSGPSATTESTAKPPPFKDPTFMVSVYVCLGLIFFFLLLLLFPEFWKHFLLGSILASVEQRLGKRTGPGRTLNRF